MNRAAFLSVLLLFFLKGACQNFYFGPSLGIGVGDLSHNSSAVIKPFWAWNAGLRAGYSVNKVFGVNADLLYQYSTVRHNVMLTDNMGFHVGDASAEVQYKSFSIPLYASLYFGDRTHLVLEGGAYLDFLHQSVSMIRGMYKMTQGNFGRTSSNGYMRVDAGLLGSMGIGWHLGQRCHMDLCLRLTRGLVDQNQTSSKAYHVNYLIRSSLVFKLGKKTGE